MSQAYKYNAHLDAASWTHYGGMVCAGRHRWVVYKDLSWPLGQEATSICPDWHGDDCCMQLDQLQLTFKCLSSQSLLFCLQAGYIAFMMFPLHM